MANLALESQKIQEKLVSSNEINKLEINMLENKLRNLDERLGEKNNLYSLLKTEYENYKIKVQHAFKRQKEQHESSTNLKTPEETETNVVQVQQLKLVVDKQTLMLNECNEKIVSLEKECESLQEELTDALQRNTKLLTDLKDKENDWKCRIQEMNRLNLIKLEQSNEVARSHEIEREAQIANYKVLFHLVDLFICEF